MSILTVLLVAGMLLNGIQMFIRVKMAGTTCSSFILDGTPANYNFPILMQRT